MSNTSHLQEGVCDVRAKGDRTFEGEMILCTDSP
jgi:hypothetical protein